MATLKQIRDGLAANLATIAGCQISPYELSQPTPPCLHIFPDPDEFVDYHQAMRNGLITWTMNVQGIVQNTDQGAQANLDRWLEPTGADSVLAALESDPTLGGIVHQAVVRRGARYQEYVRGDTGQSFRACTWIIDVLAAGT